ncbi:MAG: S9 family peptidase [Bacteroidales bacterium]|nr:S9 family peptidase [Bacteroidales bacterium]
MKINLLSLFGLLISLTALSQEKLFSPEDAAGVNRALYPASISQLQWMNGTNTFVYEGANAIVAGKPGKVERDTLFTINQLNAAMRLNGYDSLKRLPQFGWNDQDNWYFIFKQAFYAYNAVQSSVKQWYVLPEKAQNTDLHLNTLSMAYTIENNLFVVTKAGKHQQITFDSAGVVNGQTVHRNEFGIDKGTFWSPDGQRLAYYRMDERMVTNYPLVDISERVAALDNTRYPMAGMTSHQVSLGVHELQSAKTSFMQTGEPLDQYLTNVSWNPAGNMVYIALLNREQDHLKLMGYDAVSGNPVSTLLEEEDKEYVEPVHPMMFVPGKNDQFIWNSQRDGFNHLYLYGSDGRLIRQLTSGPWVVTDFVGFDQDGKYAFFMGTKESPLEQQLYRVELKTAKLKRLTTEKGTHRTLLSADGKHFIDSYSNSNVTKIIQLMNTSGKVDEVLLADTNPLKDYKLGETSLLTLKAEDGTPLHCRLIKPIDFDPNRKYPVIVYVYGGPHAQLVTESWMGGANFYLNYLAQKGYVVFTLDNRGSDHRGADFEQVIHRKVGQAEVADQMQGIAYLKSLPFVDANRIGVDGWSYGGFMSLSLKLRHPEVFKVAVAGGPVIDWKYYEVMYGERYMDSPESNPEGYAQASLLNQTSAVEGKILIIHGYNDPVVVIQNSLSFLRKCIDEGKQLDYFVYPGHEHNVRGRNRAHLITKIVGYFDENL